MAIDLGSDPMVQQLMADLKQLAYAWWQQDQAQPPQE